MNWDRKLSELELRSLCNFVLNEDNGCKVVAEKEDPMFMGEGLRQTLYVYERSDEYVFISRQKGYIMDAVHIAGDEIEEFKTMWDQGQLHPYGHALKPKDK